MSDIRDQIENLKSDLRAVEMGLQQALRAMERVPGRNELQNLMVEADEDINPDNDGKCFAMFRLGTPREFKKRESTAITVYNHSNSAIAQGDQFMVALDVWGTYYRIEGGSGDPQEFIIATIKNTVLPSPIGLTAVEVTVDESTTQSLVGTDVDVYFFGEYPLQGGLKCTATKVTSYTGGGTATTRWLAMDYQVVEVTPPTPAP